MHKSLLAAGVLALSLIATGAHAQTFAVQSTSILDGHFQQRQFANVFGCSGKNLSPQLSWSGAPQGTKSFVVTMYDPDAPTGSGWWHWVLANVPATVRELKEGAGSAGGKLPAGTLQVRGDSGMPGYLGACPPAGQTHNYVVTVYAMNVDKVTLPPAVTPAMLGFMLPGGSLGKATLTAQGGR
ncbi:MULTISPECIES: YbhB/YbcL family Raf kinase inhibitor-like protein [Pseudomonas]|uniref:YbhB/YbcL family Raf kinase inhibitor-like protein n=1 Tax=Pseudomonas TaxID=286 RepID=UPI001F32116A|nr:MULTISPECIES: YbhB/YbcL family Raf kinase inhibitor-like protein [Pseudomonas]WLH21032.1 YbhB/YbcL family Raf kinase inhibitor-like protein [Pseudomonas simiae]WLI31946.1 YbhB/YbcL family Raf kinase inhibitor-like protein [Pseudomonas rhodesiae]